MPDAIYLGSADAPPTDVAGRIVVLAGPGPNRFRDWGGTVDAPVHVRAREVLSGATRGAGVGLLLEGCTHVRLHGIAATRCIVGIRCRDSDGISLAECRSWDNLLDGFAFDECEASCTACTARSNGVRRQGNRGSGHGFRAIGGTTRFATCASEDNRGSGFAFAAAAVATLVGCPSLGNGVGLSIAAQAAVRAEQCRFGGDGALIAVAAASVAVARSSLRGTGKGAIVQLTDGGTAIFEDCLMLAPETFFATEAGCVVTLTNDTVRTTGKEETGTPW